MKDTSKTTVHYGRNASIVFFGNERLVSGLKQANTPVLDGLIKNGYKIAAIVSHQSPSRSRNNRPLEVEIIAKKFNIPLLLPEDPVQIIDSLKELNADTAVVCAYGKLIPQEIIDLFPLGVINIHPSLLPKYRGPTPIESAILDGEKETGVSLIRLTEKMDAGPIFDQLKIDLSGDETKFDIYEKLSGLGAKILLENLPAILDGSLKPKPQDDKNATYSKMLNKNDSLLNPKNTTATQAERIIRAYLGFPKTKTNLSGRDVIITKAHIETEPKSPLDIVFKDNGILHVDELIAPSGRLISGQEFLNGLH